MRVEHGDCLEVMRRLADEGVQVDAVVTDPPYHLTSIVKRFGADDAAPAKSNGATGVYARSSAGFMGKTWDGGDIAMRPETWELAYALLKPGGHLVAFGGTRTAHRIFCAIEDAGFEVRDSLCWLYGTGFPKSHNIGDGRGTALKPAHEPICLARKPLAEPTVAAQVLATGTGALNIDGCRIATDENPSGARRAGAAPKREAGTWANDRRSAETFAAARPGEALGRWPANLCHDGSDEVLEAFARFGERTTPNGRPNCAGKPYGKHRNVYNGDDKERPYTGGYLDTGTAARFFKACPFSDEELRFHYSAKASKQDRAGSKHPTVKPVALMRWLCRLVTPPGGVILDPFAGSGTTGQAAAEEGFGCILIEREAEYIADIRNRLSRDLFAGAA